jgi:uncharacterized protein YjbJ (UPF0337 family)
LDEWTTESTWQWFINGEEIVMNKNWDEIVGKWKQYSGEVKKKWGKLTDDELMEVNGSRVLLAGKLQEKYGIAKEQADKQIDQWADKMKLKF